MTHYEVLGIPEGADAKTIRKAYIEKAKALHPDRNPDPAAAEAMKAVNVAWEVLGDPQKRARYDQELEARRRPRGMQIQPTVIIVRAWGFGSDSASTANSTTSCFTNGFFYTF